MLFRVPLLKSLNCVLELIYRFEVGFRDEAEKYQSKIQEMISGFVFKPIIGTIELWILRCLREVYELAPGLKPSDPKPAVVWLHETLEFLSRALDINTLSLDVQKDADLYFLPYIGCS